MERQALFGPCRFPAKELSNPGSAASLLHSAWCCQHFSLGDKPGLGQSGQVCKTFPQPRSEEQPPNPGSSGSARGAEPGASRALPRGWRKRRSDLPVSRTAARLGFGWVSGLSEVLGRRHQGVRELCPALLCLTRGRCLTAKSERQRKGFSRIPEGCTPPHPTVSI